MVPVRPTYRPSPAKTRTVDAADRDGAATTVRGFRAAIMPVKVLTPGEMNQ